MITARTDSVQDTWKLAGEVAGFLEPSDIVLLAGDLGAGKTAFTQGLGKALGIDEHITSPTFVLMRTYKAALPLHHVDVYRLDQLQEIIDLGLLELLDEGGVAVIEWGDLAVPILPRDFLIIEINRVDDDDLGRVWQFRGAGARWAQRFASLEAALLPWSQGTAS